MSRYGKVVAMMGELQSSSNREAIYYHLTIILNV